MSVSAAELASRVRSTTGLRLGNGTAAMFLAAWLETGVVVELLPGRSRSPRRANGSRPGSSPLTARSVPREATRLIARA